MKKVLFPLAVALLLAGCVSSSTHELVVKESEARKLEIEKAAKEKETAGEETARLKKEAAALNERLDELSNKGIMTSQEIETLKVERERLSESDTAKAGEIDYLKREVERLQVKAGEISEEKETEITGIKSAYDNLVKEMEKEIEKGEIKITQAVDRLSVNLVEKVLFDSGEAEVKPGGLNVLKRVGDILKNVKDKQIRVEGHTDNVRIGAKIRERFPSNWELSTARATNVVRYLQDKVGLEPRLLSAAGFSAYKPVTSNETTEGRAQNRRIEIVLLPMNVDRVLEELKR